LCIPRALVKSRCTAVRRSTFIEKTSFRDFVKSKYKYRYVITWGIKFPFLPKSGTLRNTHFLLLQGHFIDISFHGKKGWFVPSLCDLREVIYSLISNQLGDYSPPIKLICTLLSDKLI
jgi:hypothetical protein